MVGMNKRWMDEWNQNNICANVTSMRRESIAYPLTVRRHKWASSSDKVTSIFIQYSNRLSLCVHIQQTILTFTSKENGILLCRSVSNLFGPFESDRTAFYSALLSTLFRHSQLSVCEYERVYGMNYDIPPTVTRSTNSADDKCTK